MSSAVEEQVGDPGSCCAAEMDRPHNLPPLPELSDSFLVPGKLRRSRRRVLGEKQWRSLEERGSAQLGQPNLTRWVLAPHGDTSRTPAPHPTCAPRVTPSDASFQIQDL